MDGIWDQRKLERDKERGNGTILGGRVVRMLWIAGGRECGEEEIWALKRIEEEFETLVEESGKKKEVKRGREEVLEGLQRCLMQVLSETREYSTK